MPNGNEVGGRQGTGPGSPEHEAASLLAGASELRETDRPEEALRLLDDLDRRFGAREEAGILDVVARGAFLRARILGEDWRLEEWDLVLGGLSSRLSGRPEPELKSHAAKALHHNGYVLGVNGSLTTWDPVVLTALVRALNGRGRLLAQEGHPGEAESATAAIARRGGAGSSTRLAYLAGLALFGKTVLYEEAGRSADALRAMHEASGSSGRRAGLAREVSLAQAWLETGNDFCRKGLTGEAITAYTEIICRFDKWDDIPLAEAVAQALARLGWLFAQVNQPEAALRVFNRVLSRYGHRSENGIMEAVASAHLSKCGLLRQSGRHEEAIRMLDEVAHRYGDNPEPRVAEKGAQAVFLKASALSELGRCEEGLALCDWVVRQYGGATAPERLQYVADALFTKAGLLLAAKRPHEARDVLGEIPRRLAGRQDPRFAAVLDASRKMLEEANAACAGSAPPGAGGPTSQVVAPPGSPPSNWNGGARGT